MKRWMPIIAGVLSFATPCVADVLASMPPACRVAESQIDNGFPLPAVRKAIAAKSLSVVVVGAGSSQLPGPNGASKAYPARLQAALTELLPGVTVTVNVDVKQGRTAFEMLKQLKPVVAANKPNLVIWQTGTVDALRLVEPEDFNASLSKGVGIVKAGGADAVLVNMQFSPRSESMIALGNYLEGMRWTALQQEVPLFDRFHVMKLWNELGTFDLYADTKKMDTAESVHDCIGRLLAEMINNAAKMDGTVQVPDIK